MTKAPLITLAALLILLVLGTPASAAEVVPPVPAAPVSAGEGDTTGLEASAHSSALFDTENPIALSAPPGMDEPAPQPMDASPTQNVTVNLINLMVKRGLLTQAEANGLVQQAQQEAAQAKALAESGNNDGLLVEDDTVRVTYIPESVKTEIRDQLRQEVLSQARDEGWASPRIMPEWAPRFTFFGDVRLRYEGIIYPEGNDNTGAFPNFNSINTGAPFDVSGTQFSPQYNVDQERMRLRLRARLGVDVNLEEGFSGGIRIATGESNSPTSTNQTQGLASQGQGGNFSKYSLWLDRGFLKYEINNQSTAVEDYDTITDEKGVTSRVLRPSKERGDASLAFLFGRFDNPFFTTSEIIWDEDVGFDGLAMRARFPIWGGLSFFANGGAFPIFNTDLNFSSNQPAKFESGDKWLYAGQIGLDLKLKKAFQLKTAAAVYDFNKVEGRLSTPYTPLTASDASDADNTRPSFAQRGNTYRPIRSIIPSALNNFGTSQQFQYFGLASPFKVAAYNARLDFNYFEPFQVSLLGEYAVNLDYDQESINAVAVNNRGPLADGATGVGDYEGGDTAWNVNLIFGKAAFEKRWDWNASIGYRYVESDAVVDAFSESDFGVGGTNMEGYTIGAALALSKRVRFGVRYMSANQIAGPPLKSDVFLIDLSAKF